MNLFNLIRSCSKIESKEILYDKCSTTREHLIDLKLVDKKEIFEEHAGVEVNRRITTLNMGKFQVAQVFQNNNIGYEVCGLMT